MKELSEFKRLILNGRQREMNTINRNKVDFLWVLKTLYKSWLIGRDLDAGKDWRQEEKGTVEDEMAGWHHQYNGHEFEQIPGVGDGQGGLACCSPWGFKESDTTERLNDNKSSFVELISMTEDEMVGWHHRLNGHAFEQTHREAWCATVHGVSKTWTWLQFSCSGMSDSLQPHELQHARPPCPSPTPGVHPNSCPSSRWCHPAISSSVVPFSSCPQSVPASEFSNESTLHVRWPKYWSFSYSISPSKEHPGLISFRMDWLDLLAVQGTLKSPTVQKHQFFGAQLSL